MRTNKSFCRRHMYAMYCSFLVMLLVSASCAQQSPPLDSNGNTPRDVVVTFIELIHAGDYEKAQALWILEDELYPEAKDFVSYCKKVEVLSETDIDRTNRGKSGWCHVFFKSQSMHDKGLPKPWRYSLKLVNGRWMISRRFHW